MRRHVGQIGPGTLPADQEALAEITADLGRVCGNPPERIKRVLDGLRERMLGCEPVLDVDGDAAQPGEHVGQPGGRLGVADDEAAAVEQDEDRAASSCSSSTSGCLWRAGPVHPGGDGGAVADGDGDVCLGPGQGGGIGAAGLFLLAELGG
jgi:hypothetical protein